MPEPLSLLSIACQLLGQVISLVNNSIDIIDNAKHFAERLDNHRAIVYAHQLRLVHWYEQYYDSSSEYIRLEFWGVAGRDEIERHLENIAVETKSLCRHLYGDQKEHDAQDEDQIRLVREIQTGQRRPDLGGLRLFLEGTKFVAYADRLLQRRIRVIKDGLDALETASRIQFELRQGRTERDIAKAIELRTRMSKFGSGMRRAYRQRPDPTGHWGLLLLAPESEDILDQFESDEIAVAFAYCPGKFDRGVEASRIATSYHPFRGEVDEIRACIGQSFQLALGDDEERLILEGVLRTEVLHGLTASARASIAFHIATWAALAWQTHWCRALCSCSIRSTRTRDGLEVATVNPYELHVPQNCSAVETELSKHPYLLLGILLAELGLGKPIAVHAEEGVYNFEINDDGFSSRIQLNLTQLLQRVKAAKSLQYRIAVNHCFTLDWHQSHGTRPNSRGALRVADYESYLEKILRPLSKYDKMLQQIGVVL